MSSRAIYIVDDEAALAQMANMILSFKGYEATVFSDPAKALEHMKNSPEKPTLLITDCIMGAINGLELIDEFRKESPAIKTILLSGTVTSDFLDKCTLQPDRFIPKPYSADTLIDTVDELIGKAKKSSSSAA